MKKFTKKKFSWKKKVNPIWWFQNESEQTIDNALWYHPEWPLWRRKLYWNFFRNPLQNFRAFVLGVQDRDFDVKVLYGNPNPLIVQRDDVGETGFQILVLELINGMKLPFISYSGKRFLWYVGWQPSGFFGFKFVIHH